MFLSVIKHTREYGAMTAPTLACRVTPVWFHSCVKDVNKEVTSARVDEDEPLFKAGKEQTEAVGDPGHPGSLLHQPPRSLAPEQLCHGFRADPVMQGHHRHQMGGAVPGAQAALLCQHLATRRGQGPAQKGMSLKHHRRAISHEYLRPGFSLRYHRQISYEYHTGISC